jgi:hypothetical protein
MYSRTAPDIRNYKNPGIRALYVRNLAFKVRLLRVVLCVRCL